MEESVYHSLLAENSQAELPKVSPVVISGSVQASVSSLLH